jgi:hypothetical protein
MAIPIYEILLPEKRASAPVSLVARSRRKLLPFERPDIRSQLPGL